MKQYGSRSSALVFSELLSVFLNISEKSISSYKNEFEFLSLYLKVLLIQVDAAYIIEYVYLVFSVHLQALTSMVGVTPSLSFSQFVNAIPIEPSFKGVLAITIIQIESQPFKNVGIKPILHW